MDFQNGCYQVRTCGKIFARLWVLFFYFSFSLSLFSQHYPVRSYSMDDGLANASISGITQDHNGLMWFATAQGISSYDGLTWTNYGQKDGIPLNAYLWVKVDQNNTLWACTDELNDGLFYFNRETLKWFHIPGPVPPQSPPIPVLSVALLDYPSTSPDAPPYSSTPHLGFGTIKHGFYIYSNTGWVAPATGQENHNQVTVNGVDVYDCRFYLATNIGVYYLDAANPHQWTPIPMKTPSPIIRALSMEKYDITNTGTSPFPRLWICGEEWAGYYDHNQFFLLYNSGFPYFLGRFGNTQLSIMPNHFGGLWVANIQFLFSIDSQGDAKQIRIQNTYITDGACVLFYDREFSLWTGNFRGACKMSHFCFLNYNQKDGLFDNEVTAMVEYRPGFLAFGHNGGFSFLNDSSITSLEVPGTHRKFSRNVRVLDMCLDNQGNIWAAVSSKGIVKITVTMSNQPATQTTPKSIRPPNPSYKFHTQWYDYFPSSTGPNETTSIACSPKGDILAINNDMLYQWDRTSDRFVLIKITGGEIIKGRRLFIDKDGTRYIATLSQGLLRLTGKENKITPFTTPHNKHGNSVFAVYMHKSGKILVGTAAGLFYIEGDHLSRCSSPLPMIDSPVYFIIADHEHNVWFGLNDGLIRWDGQSSRHYTPREGLVGRETNRAACTVDSRGRVWVGMELGASCYYKEYEPLTRPAPITQLLYMDASGTHYSLNQDNTLPYTQNDLTFFFRGISFINEPSVTYLINLEGFEKEWISLYQSTANQVRYTNIAPGKYRFHLRALNRDGMPSPILSSGTITIQPTFSQTWWFYLLIAAALAAFFLSFNYSISRKRRAAQLEKQVKLRTRQLEESEEELRNIFDNVHDAIFIFEPQSEIIIDANQRACDIYGYTREEFTGMSLKTISLDVSAGEKHVALTWERGIFQSFESIQYRKNGSKMFLEINASVIMYRGQKVILSVNRDVTERKLAVIKIQDSLREKEFLLKEIHHRVKNNLQIISSLLDLQSDTLEDDKINRVFMDSKNRIYSMALLHENLYQSKDLAQINISDYIQDIMDHFLSIFGEVVMRVTSTMNIAPIFLGMDASLHLGLIITELISNALKYAFPGKRTGTIHIALYPEPGNLLTLIFSDNGIGIPEDFNLASCDSLGIQLVTILTRQLKGNLEVDRTNGTQFKITLPYTQELEINKKRTNGSEVSTVSKGVIHD